METALNSTLTRVPDYLKTYVVDQDYEAYTARDHATWRFIMRHAREYLKKHAHPVYLDGLAKTGIPIGSIPKISDMDKVLNKFGWGAVCVRGFIPPLAFLDFQARKILPIAADMRTIDHVMYTPAPDIVHEAAGHAPIIADAKYANYLTRYAQIARKAIYSNEDIRLYESIRTLSDLKENPDATADQIAQAEAKLDETVASISWASEATLVARMFWWTAEYGLVGDINAPQIYGAGLLSSLSESRDALKASVKKIPLSVACTQQAYDITKPQPQLFVARDFDHLIEVLDELDGQLAYRRGELYGLRLAKKAKALTTTQLDSGLEITGIVDEIKESADGVDFVRWTGPVQLALAGKQLEGHGRIRHPAGFSMPLGRWAKFPQKPCTMLSVHELQSIGIELNQEATINFVNGFVVTGRTVDIKYGPDGKLLLLSFDNCRLERDSITYYDPSWGVFDLAVGESIPSVYGGPADWQAYGDYDLGKASTQPGRSTPYTSAEQELFALYKSVRKFRETERVDHLEEELSRIAKKIQQNYPHEWLLAVEVSEVVEQRLGRKIEETPWGKELITSIVRAVSRDDSLKKFVEMGLSLAGVKD